MGYTNLRFEIGDGVAVVTLDRPDAGNALSLDMARELTDVMMRCDEDPTVRAVLVTGAGRMFCAGGDLKSFAAQGDGMPRYIKEVTACFHDALSRIARMDAPVVAAVNGNAAGGGMSLALACDLVLVAESARFTMAYTRIGLCPDGSATYALPRLVGMRRALELALTNRVLTAEEAVEWGIANLVVPDGRLLDEARALAARLAAGPTRAFGATKRLVHQGAAGTLETQMAHESRTIADMSRAADGREGITAFVEKRTPRFTGR